MIRSSPPQRPYAFPSPKRSRFFLNRLTTRRSTRSCPPQGYYRQKRKQHLNLQRMQVIPHRQYVWKGLVFLPRVIAAALLLLPAWCTWILVGPVVEISSLLSQKLPTLRVLSLLVASRAVVNIVIAMIFLRIFCSKFFQEWFRLSGANPRGVPRYSRWINIIIKKTNKKDNNII